MFVKSKEVRTLPWIDATWYDFDIPGVAYGMVLIQNSVFRRLTPEERVIKRARQDLIDAHIEATKDPFLY